MVAYAHCRPPKQPYIGILLKVAIAIAIEITIAIDESALAATLPVQGGKDGYRLYMHSAPRISTKNN
jgi:hypothetical protein